MRRRTIVGGFLGSAVTLASLTAALAQAPGKVYRLGLLTSGGAGSSLVGDGVGRALAALGYRSGDNLVIETRSAQGDPKRLAGLVKELIALPVAAIVTLSYPAARAAKDWAGDVPVVAIGSGDPVAGGLVASLARPGANMTGISDVAAELAPKRLEFLAAAAPGLVVVARLRWDE